MYHNSLINQNVHALLQTIDDALSKESGKKPCSNCGGRLHRANYTRSPLGISLPYREYYTNRNSLCCGQCRKRFTTPSVRFFGRRRFVAAIVVLISFLKSGVTDRVISQVRRHFGFTISKRTWQRWHRWWKESFMETDFWKQAKGLLPTHVMNGNYPRALLMAYSGDFRERWVKILQFLSPLTAGIYRAV